MDPNFVDAANDDYHLSLNSPCIQEGDPCYNPGSGETDIDGDERVLGGQVDMGADEAARVHNTKKDKWYWYINEAIDDATGGDELIAYSGPDYDENVDFDGLAITLRSTDSEDLDVVKATIIDASDSGDAVTLSEGSDSILEGLTITNGNENGIYCSGSSPTIRNCIIKDSDNGIKCSAATPTIKNMAKE
jgi:hypothetical protein